MILETERLTLTPFTRDDSPLLYPMISDDEVMAHFETDGIEDPDEVDAVVAAQVAQMEEGSALYWAIRLSQTGAFLGWCQLSDIDRRRHHAEVILVLHRDAWGAGYAQEAMTAVANHAATQGLRTLAGRTQVGENRSEALMRKLGFEQQGYRRGHIDRDGERRDWRMWELTL